MNVPFDVRAVDRAHIWHPYTQHALSGDALPISRARGAYLYDADGQPLFDAISSWWVTLHGHAEPAIAAAIARQAAELEQVIFAGFTHEPAARLAESLVRIAPPGLTRVFLSDDGSTAVEVALKMVLQFWNNAGQHRPVLVALEHAYHGDTFGAMSVSARGIFTAPFTSHLFDIVRLPAPPDGEPVAALASLLDARVRDIAGVIVEPMLMGAGGMRVWPATTLRALRDVTAAHDVPLIADEVLTGFGRTGPLFACEHAGIAPDILCLSKGLTGGFVPLGATLATERIFDAFRSTDRGRTLFHGHSYSGNPIACAAAVASIALLDDASAARRRAIEAAHRAAVTTFETHPRVRNARVLGTMFAFELDDASSYVAPVGAELAMFARARGVLLRPLGNTVYVLPPYCATPSDLARVYEVIGEFLSRQ